jgi:phosphomannomutase/phosphoglucomutase
MQYAPSILDDYCNAVLKNVDKSKIKPLKIVADPGNGTSTLVAPNLLRALGANVIVINEKLDGTFPNRQSEPSEQNLQKLIASVKKEKADFGVAWDGDADRVTFVDDKGRWIVGDKCVALAVNWALLLEKNPKNKLVATTCATSKVVDDVASKFGAKTIYTDVGAPYLAEKMYAQKKDMICGGEEVGGIVWPDFSLAKDGVYATCKLMEMVSQKPLSMWHDELPKYYNAKTKVDANAEQKQKVIEHIMSKVKNNGKLLTLIGGFRLDLKDCWVLVRASGTEDKIRIFAEAKTSSEAQSLMNQYKDMVANYL